MLLSEKRAKIIHDIEDELDFACEKFPEYNSVHEGYAIIHEELDELWDEVKSKDRTLQRMYDEAKQVATTSIRFMVLIRKLKDEQGVK